MHHRRASISSTTLLPPPPQSPPPARAHTRSRHQHSRSQQLPSNSPSFGAFLHGHHYSQSLGGITDLTLSSSSSTRASSPIDPTPSECRGNTLSVEFESQVIIRPNHTIRGKVVLHVAERICLTRIRIKFHAEEVATVKITEQDQALVHQSTTTFFETQETLWGSPTLAAVQSNWEELDQGKYEFPFVLKFPNVNYPPSIDDDPKGFSIRYVWTAFADGPAGQSGLASRPYLTPYRPVIAAAPDKEWTYRTRDSKQLVQVQAKLEKQCYCPDDPFKMQLQIATLHSDSKIAQILFKFRKHHQGKLVVSSGTAMQTHIRDVLQRTLQPSEDQSRLVTFDMPTRMISPTFASRHTRVFYDLHFIVTLEESHFLKKSTTTAEFSIPIHIANLPHDEITRLSDFSSLEHYTQSTACPMFQSLLEDEFEPPSYDSSIKASKQRQERTLRLTRPYHRNMELGEATIILGIFDDDEWII